MSHGYCNETDWWNETGWNETYDHEEEEEDYDLDCPEDMYEYRDECIYASDCDREGFEQCSVCHWYNNERGLDTYDHITGEANYEYFEKYVMECLECHDGSKPMYGVCWDERNTHEVDEYDRSWSWTPGCSRMGTYYGDYMS